MDSLISSIFTIATSITLLSLFISFVRLLKGPTSADRVVALDAMTIISVALITVIAFMFKRVIYLDVALVYGLLSFLGVLAVARYIEGGL